MQKKHKRTINYKQKNKNGAEQCVLHKKIQQYEQAGITLIALVVTIIVLLILAGVTLNLVLGQNGIINRSQYASNTWSNATKDELAQMEHYSNEVERLTSDYINIDKNETVEIDYNGKTATTVIAEDTIKIGNENFTVIKNDGTTILALPYYNITLDLINPTQSTQDNKIEFAEEIYWTETQADINMNDPRNKIQPYIEAYGRKLDGMVANTIRAEVARYRGSDGLIYILSSDIDDRTTQYTTRTGSHAFYLGTCFWAGTEYIQSSDSPDGPTMYNVPCGVRPVIYITI